MWPELRLVESRSDGGSVLIDTKPTLPYGETTMMQNALACDGGMN
jgi:hypothetical protein